MNGWSQHSKCIVYFVYLIGTYCLGLPKVLEYVNMLLAMQRVESQPDHNNRKRRLSDEAGAKSPKREIFQTAKKKVGEPSSHRRRMICRRVNLLQKQKKSMMKTKNLKKHRCNFRQHTLR